MDAATITSLPWCYVAVVGLLFFEAWRVLSSRKGGATQEQLEASQRATKIATEMNTKFVRALAHDLREPIRGVVNFADLLIDHDMPEHKREQLIERIRAAARRAHDQLIELRAFALDKNGDSQDPMSVVALGPIVDDVVEALAPRVAETGAGLDVRIHRDTREARYPAALRRVLVNLIENSLKYAGSKPYIRLTTKPVDGGVELRFEDDGPGFRAKDAQRIFEPFERLAEHEQSKPGLGMGLAICREIVTQIGGEIWAVPKDEGADGALVIVRLKNDAPSPARGR